MELVKVFMELIWVDNGFYEGFYGVDMELITG